MASQPRPSGELLARRLQEPSCFVNGLEEESWGDKPYDSSLGRPGQSLRPGSGAAVNPHSEPPSETGLGSKGVISRTMENLMPKIGNDAPKTDLP